MSTADLSEHPTALAHFGITDLHLKSYIGSRMLQTVSPWHVPHHLPAIRQVTLWIVRGHIKNCSPSTPLGGHGFV